MSSNLQTILISAHSIDWTVEIVFPTLAALKLATAPLSLAKGDYTNDVESVSELRQTLESPSDRVGVELQNKNRVIGSHVGANWQEWRRATAILGRNYVGGPNNALSEWVELFRGAVQQPKVDDFTVAFDVLSDTTAAGLIVCNRTLDPTCWFVFKDAKTCAYTGSETLCNHRLKSGGGCDGRSNTHHFGGMEHNFPPSPSEPGTGGNTGGPVRLPCARLDQFLAVRGLDGEPVVKQAAYFTRADQLLDPRTGTFHVTEACEIVRGVDEWEIVLTDGRRGYSSASHPIVADRDDPLGRAVGQTIGGSPALAYSISAGLSDETVAVASPTGRKIDVLWIKMASGYIYSYGADAERLIVCHNSKSPNIE